MNELAEFTVGEHRVRPALGEIVNGSEAVHVEPRSMEVLVALSRQAPELFPKRELIETVWVDAFVSDEVLTHAIWDLRRAFGDNASDPKYIQTIPKRGYRLIAPVEFPEEKADEKSAGRWTWAGLALGALLVVGLILAAVFFRPRLTPANGETTRLVLVSQESPSSGFGMFETDLLNLLTGAPDLAVSISDACPAPSRPVHTFCLTIEPEERQGRARVVSWIQEAGSDTRLFAPSPQPLADMAGATETAREIRDQVISYFRVRRHRYFDDPDIKPWFDLSRHYVRAVEDFLVGIGYTFDNKSGARDYLDKAADRDPGFPAARIWRVPTLVASGETEMLNRYLTELDGLFEDARPFEKPMIKWAQALRDGAVDQQILQLRNAFKQSPSRPVKYLLGVTFQGSGDPEGAARHYRELADSGWEFAGLWTAWATCALLDDRMKEARYALERGRALESPDPETLELSVLVAMYDEADDEEQRYRKRLQVLRTQVEPYEFDTSPFAEHLALRAEDDGRPAAAKRLREFPD